MTREGSRDDDPGSESASVENPQRDAQFDAWYRKHFSRVRALSLRILSDSAAAEDIAQETLLTAWLHRERLREEDLGAWLSVVARNLSITHLRRQSRAEPREVLPEVPDPTADPAVVAEANDTRSKVRRAMSEVGGRHRRVLYLREIRGVDNAELASELGVTAGAARIALFRARRVLRERLLAAGEGLGLSGVMFGVHTRLRDIRLRVRAWLRSIQTDTVPILQSGVNAFLAISVVVGSLSAAPARAPLSLGREASAVAAQPRSLVLQDSWSASSMKPAGTSPNARGRVTPPRGHLPTPELDGSPYRPSDRSSYIRVRVGELSVTFERRRGSSEDGLSPAFDLINAGMAGACAVDGSICDQLEAGYGE